VPLIFFRNWQAVGNGRNTLLITLSLGLALLALPF